LLDRRSCHANFLSARGATNSTPSFFRRERGWIRGRSNYAGADPDLDQRFYYDETPPPRRYQLDEAVEAIREGRRPKVKLAEDTTPHLAKRWPKDALEAIPAPLLAALLAKELKEEQ
jgi:hypothetical protein